MVFQEQFKHLMLQKELKEQSYIETKQYAVCNYNTCLNISSKVFRTLLFSMDELLPRENMVGVADGSTGSYNQECFI